MTSASPDVSTTPDPTAPADLNASADPAASADPIAAEGDTVRLGVFLPSTAAQWTPETDPREILDFAIRAERTGLDSLWVTDSLLSPRVEALTALAAVAAITERVILGTGALLPAFRVPVTAAHTIASVDALSGGRLVLGVGAGFPGPFGQPAYAMAGTPWVNRFKRLDETVALWRRLWTADEPVSFHGEVLRLDDVTPTMRPYRPQGPPIWLGGATPAALARTGRLYDGWFPYPPEPAGYATGLATIGEAAQAAGRGGRPFTPALFVNVLLTDAADGGRAELDSYTRANYGLPIERMEQVQAMAAGTPEVVAEKLGRYVAAGARHLVMRVASLDIASQLAQLDRLVALRPGLNALLAADGVEGLAVTSR